jgi:phosphatidylglycerol:prolipoprotein diacylglycerol transferase
MAASSACSSPSAYSPASIGLKFFQVGDFIAPLVPLGLLAGRIGNFINGELWGHATSVAWGMRLPCERFPQYCTGLPIDAVWSLPLHPSQLYEAALEGAVLFVVLWWFSSRPRPDDGGIRPVPVALWSVPLWR